MILCISALLFFISLASLFFLFSLFLLLYFCFSISTRFFFPALSVCLHSCSSIPALSSCSLYSRSLFLLPLFLLSLPAPSIPALSSCSLYSCSFYFCSSIPYFPALSITVLFSLAQFLFFFCSILAFSFHSMC